MTRRLLALAQLPIYLTVALVAALVSFAGLRELAVRIYVIALAGLALAALVAHVRRSNPVATRSAFDRALRRRRDRPERLPDLERVERELMLAQQTAADVHFRLRPRVRRITKQLLASRRGIDLDADPEGARRALGEELWELVRADRPMPARRDGPGIDLAASERMVIALEEL